MGLLLDSGGFGAKSTAADENGGHTRLWTNHVIRHGVPSPSEVDEHLNGA